MTKEIQPIHSFIMCLYSFTSRFDSFSSVYYSFALVYPFRTYVLCLRKASCLPIIIFQVKYLEAGKTGVYFPLWC